MNDFTKDELIAIRDNLSAAYTPEENSILYGIYEKIQSMIDNYPEIYHLPKDAKIGDKITIPASDKGWIIK